MDGSDVVVVVVVVVTVVVVVVGVVVVIGGGSVAGSPQVRSAEKDGHHLFLLRSRIRNE